jgi:hypothetical protein
MDASNKVQKLSCTSFVFRPHVFNFVVIAFCAHLYHGHPKKHFSLNDILLTSIDHREKSWCAKLPVEKEAADQLLARLVNGETDRGGCIHRDQSVEAREWRLNCSLSDHDKSARKAAASAAQSSLVSVAQGAAQGTWPIAQVQIVRAHRFPERAGIFWIELVLHAYSNLSQVCHVHVAHLQVSVVPRVLVHGRKTAGPTAIAGALFDGAGGVFCTTLMC